MSESLAGRFLIGEFAQLDAHQPLTLWPFRTPEELRAYVAGVVREVLEQDAREISEHQAFQPVQVPTGICCACKHPGSNVQMEWQGHHLIHATDECRALAAAMPETREHRG